MINKIKILLLSSLFLVGCDLSPEYKIPETNFPNKFKSEEEVAPFTEAQKSSWKQAEPSDKFPRGEWWKIFEDENLNKIQQEFLSNNLDIKILEAKTKQARSSIDVVSSEFFPDFSVNSGVTRQKLNSQTFGFPAPAIKPFSVYSAGFGLDYEIDLFGKVFTKMRSIDAEYNAFENDKESIKLALQADVTQYYITLKSLDEELKLTQENINLRQENLNISNKKLELGAINKLDLARDAISLNTEIARLSQVKQARSEVENALLVMLGKNPSNFILDKSNSEINPPQIPPYLPSKLLERRPDVASAERKLYSANEMIGFARAAFFPSISLTSNAGLQSTSLSDVMQWSNRVWSIAPMINFPIFEGGRTLANLEKNKAIFDEANANYRKQVLVAFKDVEDSLSLVSTSDKQLSVSKNSLKVARESLEIMRKKFTLGDISKFEFNDAKISYNNIKIVETQAKRGRLNASVQLIRALGGGFAVE
ncbi:MAG: efflux transporter outer membrane subunit [Rickettsiales bacterium]|nr:efflux transporter outer membrane subunit [Rickettsiales bacterium]